MAKKAVTVTGLAELDAALAKLPEKVQKQHCRKAARSAAKFALEDFQARVPVDTGAMRDAAKVRAAPPITVKVKTGKSKLVTIKATGAKVLIDVKKTVSSFVAAKVIIDGELLIQLAMDSGRPIDDLVDQKRGGWFFYPATVELGTSKESGKRTLTKSLWDNSFALKSIFLYELRKLVREVGAEQ